MKRKISTWTALFLTGSLLLGNGIPYKEIGATTVYAAAADFGMSMSPSSGATYVNTTASIRLYFDRTVTPQSGNITITNNGTNALFTTVPLDAGIIGNSTFYDIKWAPSLQFQPNTTYTVNIPAGSFKDSSGGSSLVTSWSFTTSPVVNSSITLGSLAPVNNSRVAANSLTELSFKLNKANMLKGNGYIKLMSTANNSIIYTYNVATDTKVLLDTTSDPTSTLVKLDLTGVNLTGGTSYYVLMDSYAFRNADNTTFGGLWSGTDWSFSTIGSNAIPVTVSPALGSGNISPTGALQLVFDRPMFPAAGEITVSPGAINDARARRINVTSTSVTGGGSRTITIVPATTASPLLNSTNYTVTIPQEAFHDQDGHLFPATGTSYSWSYSTASTAQPLTITSMTPTDRSESVAVNRNFTFSFNRDVVYNNSIANGIVMYKSGGSKVPITVQAGATAKDFIINLVSPTLLDYESSYYIDIANGVFTDAADPLSVFGGLNGRTQWLFTTPALDKTAPVLLTAALENNRTIHLKYNEALDASTALLVSSFPVTINDENRGLDSAYISGDSVYLTMSTGVAVGQVIKVSYNGGTRTIKDASGNTAAAFSLKQVSNGMESALPLPKDGIVSGQYVTLSFNDSLKPVSSYASNQFSVTSDGTVLGINSITSGGGTVYLTLSSAPANGSIVRVSYNAASYPLQDVFGQNIANFSNFFIRNANDTIIPQLQTATGSGNKIVLTYNEGLSTTNQPANNQFSVLAAKIPVFVTDVAVVGNKVTLTLASALSVNQNVTVSYVPGSTGISDLNGNRAGYINIQNVTLSAVSAVPEISSATITGDTLNVTFVKNMISNSIFSSSQFAVRADGSNIGIQSASVSGNILKLTLSTIVKVGQVVDLSYMAGTGTITDMNGIALPSFTTLNVQNVAGSSTTAGGPTYLTTLATSEFGKSYPLLKSDSAQATDDTSKYNQVIKKYTLSAERLTGGYDFLLKQGSNTLVFEVPSTERAAYVSVPLVPLIAAVSRNKSAEFAIRYGDYMYSIPLDKVDLPSLARNINRDSNTISLIFRMENVPTGTFSSLEQKLQNNSLQNVSSPMDIRLLAGVSDNSSNPVELNVPGEYSVRTTATFYESQVFLAKLDTSYGDASYLPTRFSKAGNYTIIRAKAVGSQVLAAYLSIRKFSDMSTHWSRDAVSELATKNIIDSSYGTNFKPEQKITRAEFAVMLSRGLGLQGNREGAQGFRDVQSSTQIGDYIGAAAKAGIITGNVDGTFRPNANITREQMAIMMIRAMEYTNNPVTLNGTSASVLATFKDKNKIQGDEFVAKAFQAGIVQGVSAGVFQPQGNATRAQAAVMLKRMLNKVNYL